MSENQKKLSSSFWVGVIILLAGSFLLLDRLDLLDFPRWLFSWKTFLITIGLIIGFNKKFEGIGWLVMILIGSFFLLEDIPGIDWELHDYAFPVGVIIVGLFILSRAVLGGSNRAKKDFWKNEHDGFVASDDGGEDYFDIVAVFGGSKRKVFSKNFKGGDATCIFGGVDVDLSQADINGTIVIDATQIFGGMKLLVPANWEIKSDAVAIFGSVEDKRIAPTSYTPGKKLVIDGFVMFGGIDIKSY